MAQEIFHYFGHDGIGTIGNDTTLATADMDGIIMICLQALEKRTRELKEAQETITRLNEEFQRQQAELAELKNAIRALTGASGQENQGVSISEKRNR
jgi:septal ring factor EnvC (AmiA/AmiB activator)